MIPDQIELAEDSTWQNRETILALLAPRTAPRPARRTPATSPDDDAGLDLTAKKPSALGRAARRTARLCSAAWRQLDKRIPPGKRARAAMLCCATIMILVAALSGLRYLATDLNPPAANTPSKPDSPAPPPSVPLTPETVLTGVTVVDRCPQDDNHSDPALAVDDDSDTAWTCTRADNNDGQLLMFDFGRQVTLTQIRAIGGFDAVRGGVDMWSEHRLVTKLEVWFPKELGRDPVIIPTGAVRDWRGIDGGLHPPATLSKVIVRIAETSPPPPPRTPPTETTTAAAAPDDEVVTTVAISEIQFVGYDGPARTTQPAPPNP